MIERVALTSENVSLAYAEAYGGEPEDRRVTYRWRFDFRGGGREADPVEIVSRTAVYVQGREPDDPAFAFGWQLAEAVGWRKHHVT